jgi:hypothetical protein
MKMNRIYAAMALMGCVAAVLGCSDLSSEPDPPFDPAAAVQTIAGTRITWAKGGHTSAIIMAKTLERYQSQNEVHLRDSVQVDIYDDNDRLAAVVYGQRGVILENSRTAQVDSGITVRFLDSEEFVGSTLVAQSATADDRQKNVIAKGNVRVESENGVVLTTELLIWEGRNERFRAPGEVTVTNGTDIEQGRYLTANADLSEWTMREIHGTSTRSVDEIQDLETQRKVNREAASADSSDSDDVRLGF